MLQHSVSFSPHRAGAAGSSAGGRTRSLPPPAAFLLLLLALPLGAQQQPEAPPPAATATPLPEGLATLVPAATEAARRKEQLAERLASLPEETTTIQAELTAAASRLDALFQDLEALRTAGIYTLEQVIELRARAREAGEQLQGLSGRISRHLEELESRKRAWTDERQRWEEWRSTLRARGELEQAASVIRGARSAVDAALAALVSPVASLVELQKSAAQVEARYDELSAQLDRLLESVRRDLFRRSAPSLFSPSFYRQFDAELVGQLWGSLRDLSWIDPRFLETQGYVVFLQLALALGLGLVLRANRKLASRENQWRFLLERPWSTAILVSVSGLSPLYTAVLPGWRLCLWALAGLSAMRLLALLLKERWQRALVFGIAGLFLLSQFFRITGIPRPFFRLYIVTAALLGAVVCFGLGARGSRGETSRLTAWLLRGSGGLLGIVVLAQAVGYNALATHVFESSIKTLFLGLFAWMLVLLVRGAVRFAVTHLFGRRSVVYHHRRSLIRRADGIVVLAVGTLAFLTVLQVWGFFDTPMQAWRSLAGLGVTIGETELTLGLLLTAAVLLYATLLLSRGLQSVLAEEVYPRRGLEEGIGVSINRLLHYALVAAGFFLVLGALGFNLQSFAIVGGAIGIGIGFGLQAVVNNFVSGLILLAERPVKVGDTVVIGGQWGQIRKIGLRATVMQTFDRSEVVLPNSELISSPVTNWTLSSRSARLEIAVGVAYGSDVTRVMQILREVAAEHPLVLSDPEPMVLFLGFGESSLDFELRVWLEDVGTRLATKSDLNQAVDRRFREAEVEIPFPQRDVHFRNPLRLEEGEPRAGTEASG